MENPHDYDPAKWYYAWNGQSEGPFTIAEMKEFLRVGHLTDETLVAELGSNEWAPLSSAFQLKCSAKAPLPPKSNPHDLGSTPQDQKANPASACGKGCLVIFGIFVIILVGAFISDRISNNSKKEKDALLMETLEGRAAVLARNAGMESVEVEITPQADDMERVKVTFDFPNYSSNSKNRAAVFERIARFLDTAKQNGGFGNVSSFWFSPMGNTIDQYGNRQRRFVAKLVLEKEEYLKMNWENASPAMTERIFEEEATLWWLPAFRE